MDLGLWWWSHSDESSEAVCLDKGHCLGEGKVHVCEELTKCVVDDLVQDKCAVVSGQVCQGCVNGSEVEVNSREVKLCEMLELGR